MRYKLKTSLTLIPFQIGEIEVKCYLFHTLPTYRLPVKLYHYKISQNVAGSSACRVQCSTERLVLVRDCHYQQIFLLQKKYVFTKIGQSYAMTSCHQLLLWYEVLQDDTRGSLVRKDIKLHNPLTMTK